MLRMSLAKLLMLVSFLGLTFALIQVVRDKPAVEIPVAIAISPGGQRVATITETGKVTVFDLQLQRTVASKLITFGTNSSEATDWAHELNITFASEQEILVSRNPDPMFLGRFSDEIAELRKKYKPNQFGCKSWDLRTGRVSWRVEGLELGDRIFCDGVHLLRTRFNGATLELGTIDDQQRRIFDVRQEIWDTLPSGIAFGSPSGELLFANNPILSFALTGDRKKIAFVTGRVFPASSFSPFLGTLKVCDAEEFKQIDSELVTGPEFRASRTGKYWHLGGYSFMLFDANLVPIEPLVAEKHPGVGSEHSPFRVKFSQDEKRMAIAGGTRANIYLFDLDQLEIISEISNDSVVVFEFSKDGRTLCVFSGNEARGLEVYGVTTGEMLFQIRSFQKFWPLVFCGCGYFAWVVVSVVLWRRWKLNLKRDG